ncbi:FAD:protein FMN transferase [Tenacibaculum sp. nBUS_03]|uniref:FAD:protein FMN transferase n=1 Tax=Tenacibaculum sp. nBUS_03 TaxID=3395320 RepID=UPI003EB98908
MFRLLFLLFSAVQIANAQKTFKKKALLMGVDFEFTVVAEDQESANHFLEEAIKETIRVENLISSWKSSSQTSNINRNAGVKPVVVDNELLQLIKRSKRISELTNGFFDISFASLDKIWYFNKPMEKLPDSSIVKKSVSKINYKNIVINDKRSTVFLTQKGMKIGFGSIGKGYVAEKVKKLLQELGVTAGLVNASGDLTTWGNHPITKNWKINIADPNGLIEKAGKFDLHNNSVVTSGNYANYIEFNNKRYSHIINPKTGWPVSGLKSVTIFCKNTELADALATSVFVLGKEKGLELVNQLNGIECLLISDDNKLHPSKNLNLK